MVDNLPTYRFGELPEHLATATMLRRQRRRLADGQPCVGWLRYRGNKHAPLFEIAASVPLPALTGKRQAAWTAARTCARCQATSDTPWPVYGVLTCACAAGVSPAGGDRRRLCSDCARAEMLAAARASWLRLRAAAVTWAQDVLADPDTAVLAVYIHDWGHPTQVRAETVTGEVLVDLAAVQALPAFRRVLTPGAVNADEIIPHLMPLVGRRLVHTIGTRRGGYADHVSPLGKISELCTWLRWGEQTIRDPSIRERHADAFRPRWTDWHARPWSGGDGIHHAHHGHYGLTAAELPGDTAAEITARMRAGLAVMATDTHPDGPPTCPWLPPTGRTPCGAGAGPHGLCPDHTPED
ncbi:hypothetical protein ACGFI9_21830 [Micromonospora sp. NPDC048930]|uniref:hypothetical protein n=1 Tax=Micromonospora sp. NPDC048930 TaxID=3364261 RepID=UPI003716F56E